MPNLHPLIIHFPIVLLYLSVGLEVLFLCIQTEYIKKSARLRTIGVSVAVFTGWLAHKSVPHSEWSLCSS